MPVDRVLRHLIAWQSADGPPTRDCDLTLEQARERYRTNAIRQHQDEENRAAAVTSVDQLIPDLDGASLAVRVYTPQWRRPRVLTFLHGGGWVLGDLDSHDWVCRSLAVGLRATVVSVDYRRAPEFPYPTPLHDAIAAARWTARTFPDQMHLIGGDSAGASLALGVVLEARDLDFAGQLLFYPALDPSLTIASASDCSTGYLLSVDDLAWNYEQYVPDRHRRAEPAVDLLRAEFRSLPPTVIATAEFDPLRDEGTVLAAQMRAAGAAVRQVPGEGLVHGYFLMQGIVPAAAAEVQRVIEELDRLLPADNEPGPGTFLQDTQRLGL